MRLTSTELRETWQRAEAEWGGQGGLWDPFQAKEGRGKRGGLHEIIQKRNDGFCVCCGHRSPWACPWIGKGRYGRSQKSTHWKKKNKNWVWLLVIRKGGKNSREEIKMPFLDMKNTRTHEIFEGLHQGFDTRAQRRGEIGRCQQYMVSNLGMDAFTQDRGA